MKKYKYILSNSGKFHHFEVAKELYKRNQLEKIICGYPWFKLRYENIPKDLVLAKGGYNIIKYPFRNNSYFEKISEYLGILNKKNIDRITSEVIDNHQDADVLLSLAGVSLNSGAKMTQKHKIYICERSSAHISYQNDLLINEYKEQNNNKKYVTNKWFIENEIKEYENANLILVPSNFVKNTFDKSLKDKTRVLGFGSDTNNFFPDSKIEKSKKYFDILFIGQKSLRKGLHYLVDAFYNFKHPNKRLHIVGSDTNDKDFFKKKLKNENILLYGHIPQSKLNDIINKCHVFVLPSIEDGFGIVVLQAAAGGCPSIVSHNTGASDFVIENNCGFVVPIKDSNAITDKLQHLSDDKNLLKDFSIKAINATKKYTWSDYVDKLEKLIFEFNTNKI
tara:strand:+ start:868 stop:2043 length:1176 start_codon:yes stop_codon:yes gene_type:complete